MSGTGKTETDVSAEADMSAGNTNVYMSTDHNSVSDNPEGNNSVGDNPGSNNPGGDNTVPDTSTVRNHSIRYPAE